MTDEPSVTFVWTIKNFHLCHTWPTGDPYIRTSIFHVEGLEWQFWLELYPGGEEASSNHVELHLNRTISNNETVDYELSFLSADDTPPVTHKERIVHCGGVFKMKNCPTVEEIFVTKRSAFLLNDALKVRFRMWTPEKINVKPWYAFEIGDMISSNISTRFYHTYYSIKLHKVKYMIDSPDSTKHGSKTMKIMIKHSGNTIEELGVDFNVFTNFFTNECLLTLKNKFDLPVKFQRKISPRINNEEYCFEFENFISRKQLLERIKEFPSEFNLPIFCDFLILSYKTSTREFSNESQVYKKFPNFASQMSENQKHRTLKQNLEMKPNERLAIGFRNETGFPTPIANIECKTSEFKSPRPSNSATSSSDPPPLNILQQDLLSLYTERKLCDFELRTESTSFPVHKIILAARSPVFKALFESDMREVASGFQDVLDIDKGTLDRLLHYIYTGVLREFQWEEAAKLYCAADKYEILSLKEMCSSYLQNNVEGSNMYETLELAGRHSDHALNSAVVEFLLDKTEEITISEEWRLFTNRYPLLAAETMRKMISRLTTKRK